jgi:NADH:flavin oxidoreductase / NADH oxidase family
MNKSFGDFVCERYSIVIGSDMKNNSTKNSLAYGLKSSKLYQPILLGTKTLQNRIAIAPLTRYRAIGHVVNQLHVEYYKQRATAGLIVTEATFISQKAGGYANAPGIYNRDQVGYTTYDRLKTGKRFVRQFMSKVALFIVSSGLWEELIKGKKNMLKLYLQEIYHFQNQRLNRDL